MNNIDAARNEAIALWNDVRNNNSGRSIEERRAALRKANAATQRLKAAKAGA